MKFKFLLLALLSFVISERISASHGMALVNPNIVAGATGVTVTASSNGATCGGGPYWLQAEIRCTAGQLTGTPPATMQTMLATWPGPGVTVNNFPWFNSLLNVPNYTQASGWPDNCVTEAYHPIVIPYTNLCPGQVYYIAAREWVSGTNSVGPWTAAMSFTVPGTFTPINYNIAATPTIFCSPGSSNLTISSITGGCGQQSVQWLPGGMTGTNITVSPLATTVYTAIVSTPCNTLSKVVTVSVVPSVSAAFTPANSTGCVNVPVQFTHTGTGGVNHIWAVSPAAGVNINTSTSANPLITFPNTGIYTISHTVSAGTCSNVVVTSITINGVDPSFTIPNGTQCFATNSFNFNATSGAGTHGYSFNPAAGAPASGAVPNYGPVSFTSPGTYTVTHTVSQSGCNSSTTAVIVVNPQPSLTVIPTNANCSQNNGQIVINNTSPAGQTVVSFSLNGSGIPSQTVTGLGAGTYTVGLTNNFGCFTNTTTTVGNTPGVTALATTFVNPTCGNANGSITLGVVTGGTAPYVYSVNGGALSSTPPLTNLAAGSYTILVQDANNCQFTKIVTLTNIPGPTAISFTTNPTTCVGNTGQIGITGVTGGTAPYSYSVNGVSTGAVAGGLAAGPKTITVSDNNGCTFTTTANIATVPGPSAANINTTSATCGNSNGSATVSSVTGGVAPYQYSFNGGAFSASNVNTGLAAGPKNVIIMDANSCTVQVNYVIGNTGSPTSALATQSNVSCSGGANGSFSVGTTGGTPGYNYTLTPSNITNAFGSFTGLTAQNYTVTVKDAVGCITTVTVGITQPTPLTLSANSNQPKCFGGNNGTITATAGGGVSPYQYNINGGANQASNVFTNNITATGYNVTVTDANGCTLSTTVNVTQPAALSLTMSSNPAVCSAPNGTASVNVSGGTPIYTYTWSPTGGNNATAANVSSGNYTVTVKDVQNCTLTGVVSVTQTPGGTASITNVSNVTCFGAANGSLTATMNGAFTPPLTYSWTNGAITQTNPNLGPGSYTVQITDLNGCKSFASGTITQPATITVATATTAVACFNGATGAATAAVLGGGTPGFTYLWSPGGQTTNTVGGLTAGNYSVQITDANGCIKINTITITQPSSVTINTGTTSATCNQANGSATATAAGGTGPYTYTWSTGTVGSALTNAFAGTYTIQVKDNNGCLYALTATIPNASGPSISIASQTNVSCNGGNNGIATATTAGGAAGPGFPVFSWSNGQNAGTATNLSAGLYTVSVTDASGCVATTSVNITQPLPLSVNVSGTNPKCFNATNGTANAGVAGGTGPYSYAWLPAPGAGGTTSTPSGLSSGNYAVTVTDSKGCTIQGTVNLVNPPQMLASIASTNVSCFNACNGQAIASTTNAVGVISYYYTGGAIPLTTQNVSNLCPGTYTMLATDQNTCQASVVFNITQPTALTVGFSAVGNVSCSSGNNGFATASPNGGTTPYSYTWSNGQSVATATGLVAGNYTVTITDNKGCTVSNNVTITQPLGLTVTATSTNVTCNSAANGIGNVNYGGGTGVPSILWQPSLSTNQTALNLAPGVHTVTLNDANNCPASTTINITQPAPLVITSLTNTSTNCLQNNGSATVVASGGAGGFTYQWSGNPTYTLSTISGVVAGAYTIVVTDANNCNVSAITTINDIAGPSVTSQANTSVTCNGLANAMAGVVASGGVGTLSYNWSYLGQTTSTVTNLPNGLHSVTITDGAGCVTSATFNIVQPTPVASAIGSQTNVACSGANNGGATVLSNGGNPGYTYTWNSTPAQNSATLTNVGPGTYTVIVKDVNNCATQSSVTITTPNPLIITTNSTVPVSCNSGSSGSINTTISGGTPAYILSWTPAQPANPSITNLTAGNYTLLVTDQQGCSTNSVYTITEPTALTIASSATTPATCGNANGTATVTIAGGTSPYTYNWNTPAPQLTSNASNLASGNWVLTTTDNKGCVISNTVTIYAPPLPSVTAQSSNPLCNGQSNGTATLTASGVGPFTYNWNPTGLTTAIITGLGPAVYTATITDLHGCNTFTSVNITQPNPLSLIPSPIQTICYGKSTTVYGIASGGTAPYNYTLTELSSGASTSSTTPGSINVNQTLTTTTQYTVTVVDANGCANGPQSILVNVTPNLLAVGMSSTVCENYKVVLVPTITSPGNGGPYTYFWSNGATTSNNTVTAVFNNSPQNYTLTVSDGCTIPDAQAVFTVVANPSPQFTFTPSSVKGCAPLSVQFEAGSISTAYDASGDVYYWSFQQGGESSNGAGNPKYITYPAAGSYSFHLVVTNSFGCKSDTSTAKIIEVHPVPKADFTANPLSGSIMEPSIRFTNQSQGANSYVWDFGDYGSQNNSSTLMHPEHTYEMAGFYKVYLAAINMYGCKDTTSKIIEIAPDVAVYIPNAFTPDQYGRNDVFQPKGVGINEDKYKMEIYDRWGELIFTSNAFRTGWDGTVKGSGQVAQDGVYIYKIFIVDLQGNKKYYTGHVSLLKQ